MRRLALAIAMLAVVVAALVLAHLVLIEVGREVVTLRTPGRDGELQQTRLWIVDDGASSWLHAAARAGEVASKGTPWSRSNAPVGYSASGHVPFPVPTPA